MGLRASKTRPAPRKVLKKPGFLKGTGDNHAAVTTKFLVIIICRLWEKNHCQSCILPWSLSKVRCWIIAAPCLLSKACTWDTHFYFALLYCMVPKMQSTHSHLWTTHRLRLEADPWQSLGRWKLSPGSLPIHCFETFTYDIRPCITQGMKIISGSSWSAWVFLPLSMHLSLPFPHVPSLLCIFYQTAILRSAWTFPVDFPSTWPGTPPGTPPETPPRTPPWRSPRTPPGTPPASPPGMVAAAPVTFSPMTPPELLQHLLAPSTPEGV